MTLTTTDAIELDFRCGILPISAICAKYGVSTSYVIRLAKQQGWERQPKGNVVVPLVSYPHDLDDIRKVYLEQGSVAASARYDMPMQTLARIAQEDGWASSGSAKPEYPLDPEYPHAEQPRAVSLFAPEDIDRARALALATVVHGRRQTVMEVKAIFDRMVKSLDKISRGLPPDFEVMGERESFQDAMGKTVITMGKILEAEERVFNLTSAGGGEEANKENEALLKLSSEDRRRKINDLLGRVQPVSLPAGA